MSQKLIFMDGQHAPQDYIEFFDDFLAYAATDWLITTTEAGGGDASEAIAAAGVGGHLVVTNDSNDDDADFFQKSNDGGTTAHELFKYVAGKRLYFGARFKLSDVTQSDFVFGLHKADTGPLAVTDGLLFQKDDGDALLDFHATKDSTATDVTGVATLADDTFVVIEAYYDGANAIELYVNGAPVGSCALTNVPDDEELTLGFGVQNGAAAAKVLTVDWIRVMQER